MAIHTRVSSEWGRQCMCTVEPGKAMSSTLIPILCTSP
jgi:hypothetical protein